MAFMDWSEINWQDLIPKMVAYASVMLRARGGGSNQNFKDPDDYVYAAVMKTINGNRVWKSEKVSIYGHIMGVIKSDISNDYNKIKNYRFVSTEDYDVENVICNENSPEDILYEREINQKIEEKLLEKNKTYHAIYGYIKLGSVNDNEISKIIGCNIRTVYNAKKCIKNIFDDIARKSGGL